MQVDFVAFSGHKMLAPTGVGCLFGKRDVLEELRPLAVGGGMVDWVDLEDSHDRKIPHRFEAGTPAVSSVIGLGAAIAYLDGLGREQQVAHHRALTNALLRCTLARDYIELIGPRDSEERCAIASFRIRGCEAVSEVARALSDSYGVMCRSGNMCAQPVVSATAGGEILRVSAYVYNTVSEIESAFDALDELIPYLSAKCAP